MMNDKDMGLENDREPTRTGMSVEALKRAFLDNIFYLQGRTWETAAAVDLYHAAAYTVRDRLLDRWIRSARTYKKEQARTVCYLSAEYLLGPQLRNNLINLGIVDQARRAGEELGLDFEGILATEEEPGLGNGGLGRLAACYLDSMATLQIPAIGYGIRYEFGMFDQKIEDGWQVEVTDAWLRNGNPWELPRPKLRFPVRFGGHTEHHQDERGRLHVVWRPDLLVNGMAYDIPIVGYGVNNVNLLRLWKSEAPKSFDFHAFNKGDYYGAVDAKVVAENICKVLYPNDEPEAGKALRLKQQYFFVSCSLQDMIRLHLGTGGSLNKFHLKFTAQLNDTHPALAVTELMRLLLDEHGMGWDDAWAITRRTFAYTNHTLLPEALETWSEGLLRRLLPRHLELVYEINRRFLDAVRMRVIGDQGRLARMSIIGDHGARVVRMANLATVGSYAVNGVSRMHSRLLETTVLRDFHEMWPEHFHNVTNGVTPRRFLKLSNPRLADLLDETIGGDWVRDLVRLRALEELAEDPGFQQRWAEVKRAAKREMATCMAERTGIETNPESMFDIQVKRIHEYKRQHLNVLHIITLYERMRQDGGDLPPRTFIFGGKAAPGYAMAKLMIKLINAVGGMINDDPQMHDRLKVVFVPDFNVKNSRWIYPAADLSEQISTAGKEASGTGNMKFTMNGALTIGTLDGANVEIREEVGEENFFHFGLTVEEVAAVKGAGYRPRDFYEQDAELKAAIDLIASGFFSHGDAGLFRPLVDNLLDHDPFLVLADYRAYVDCQARVGEAWLDSSRWQRMSILNTARSGRFSSDRAIGDYCWKIWKVEPVPVA